MADCLLAAAAIVYFSAFPQLYYSQLMAKCSGLCESRHLKAGAFHPLHPILCQFHLFIHHHPTPCHMLIHAASPACMPGAHPCPTVALAYSYLSLSLHGWVHYDLCVTVLHGT